MSRRRLDSVETIVIVLVAAAVAFAAGSYEPLQRRRATIIGTEGAAELESLAQRYGEGRVSRFAEEWIIRDFFQDRRDGTFLDVGANDYRQENNTYYLETALGWHGIAIDAQSEYADGYRAHRPKTKFFALFVSDTSDASVDFYVPTDNRLAASSDRASAESEDEAGGSRPHAVVSRKVPTITLNDLLARQGLEHVDFVSMDIELAEPKALAGFDIDRLRPAFLCIEGHRDVRQAILDYFMRHHYAVVAKYLRMDSQNLYFAPVVDR